MLSKSAQSLMNLFDMLSGENSLLFSSPVSNKEAQTLYDIWRHSNKDEYGRIRVPEGTDSFTLSSLADKRMIRKVDMRLANVGRHPLVEITKEGQQIIRDIILHTEKSSFEGDKNHINYEKIYRDIKLGPRAKKE